jgi:hypothetical protein
VQYPFPRGIEIKEIFMASTNGMKELANSRIEREDYSLKKEREISRLFVGSPFMFIHEFKSLDFSQLSEKELSLLFVLLLKMMSVSLLSLSSDSFIKIHTQAKFSECLLLCLYF